MNNAELAKRQERAVRETYVIAQTPEGFRVYAPTDPKRAYLVTGSAEQPACTCPDFGLHAADPTWRCKHILAVLGQQQAGNGAATAPDPYEAEERRAIQEEGHTPRKRKTASTNGNGPNGTAHMLVKRSVSPDGRIDSLSVEFSTPLDSQPDDAIRDRAQELIALQSSIVGGFLNRRESPPAARPAPHTNGQARQPSVTAPPNGGSAVPPAGPQAVRLLRLPAGVSRGPGKGPRDAGAGCATILIQRARFGFHRRALFSGLQAIEWVVLVAWRREGGWGTSGPPLMGAEQPGARTAREWNSLAESRQVV